MRTRLILLFQVSAVMTKDLTTLPETGMRVKDVGRYFRLPQQAYVDYYCEDSLLSKSNVKGFPVVSADGSLTLVGWIDRSEIRYVLGEFADKLSILQVTWHC